MLMAHHDAAWVYAERMPIIDAGLKAIAYCRFP
jgi:hypothetical protein